MHPHIIIHTGGTQVGTGKSIVQCPFRTDGPGADGTVHKNAVAGKEVFKFLQYSRIFFQEFFQFCKIPWN